ncbi:carboxymuconolactone decarboxylase family protein [Aeromicrobium sp. UC242_57]|uniref:carboxymuconolactone decarboxylase family protein n=1 Tax=Aeromicrobium sp. UC242_57 TaxID=3374624 RepID=UPI00378BB28D
MRPQLPVLEREVVILVVAVAEGSDFMWAGHLPIAVAAGLDPDVGALLRSGTVPRLDEPLLTVHHVARCLVDDADLDDSTFQRAVDLLGWPQVQEIVWLTGLYQAFGLAMRVARTPLPTQADTSDAEEQDPRHD